MPADLRHAAKWCRPSSREANARCATPPKDAEDSVAAGARDLDARKSFAPRCGCRNRRQRHHALRSRRARICASSAARSPSASPRIRIRRWRSEADIAIAPDTGPEAIAGSTRLKAGTAQKMVLNLLSTAAMVRMGRVYENWMVHVALTNQNCAAAARASSKKPRL